MAESDDESDKRRVMASSHGDAGRELMSAALAHQGTWTVADIEALPEDGKHRRYEILTRGVLTMSPAPSMPHQRAARQLANLLEQAAIAAGMNVDVFEAVNVTLPGGLLAIPDIIVVRGEFADIGTTRCPAEEVILAAEIVSPGSRTQDRSIKPRLYAEAGIPHFWRLELAPAPRLYIYQLVGDHYGHEVVTTSTTSVNSPFPITVTLSTLVTRRRIDSGDMPSLGHH